MIEGTPPRLESGGVDVEFAFPRFKQRRSMKVEAEGAAAGGKATRKIRYTLYLLNSELLNSYLFIYFY